MSDITTYGFAIIIMLAWIIPIVCLIRTHFVSSIRQQLLRDDYPLYKQLPSYETMMFQYRYWTINQYAKKYANGVSMCDDDDVNSNNRSRKLSIENIITVSMLLPYLLLLLWLVLAVVFGY